MGKVISNKQTPINPFRTAWGGAFLWLLMDRLRPPVAVQAVVWTLYAIILISFIIVAFKQEQVELKELKD